MSMMQEIVMYYVLDARHVLRRIDVFTICCVLLKEGSVASLTCSMPLQTIPLRDLSVMRVQMRGHLAA